MIGGYGWAGLDGEDVQKSFLPDSVEVVDGVFAPLCEFLAGSVDMPFQVLLPCIEFSEMLEKHILTVLYFF